MKICIHKGADQIGGSCIELISQDKRIILDLGLPLDAEKNDISLLPKINGLTEKDESILAVIISHPHLDHFGLLAHINKDIPIIIGAAARRIINTASLFINKQINLNPNDLSLQSEKTFELGPFSITPYLIDHSAYDSYALLIEVEGKRIFYSGDFRMHGRKSKLTKLLMDKPPENIDTLMIEGTTVNDQPGSRSFITEDDMENKFVDVFNNAKGLSLVHTSSQNIDRMVTIFRACKKAGKTMIIDLYTTLILEATENSRIPQSDWPQIALYIPQSQRIWIKNEKQFDFLKKHSHNRVYLDKIKNEIENYVLIFREIHIPDLEWAGIKENLTYIFSQWQGYWEGKSFTGIKEWIIKNNIKKINLHTSGHAGVDDLKQFANALNPTKIVPIHTSYPEKFKELFKNAQLHCNGEYWEV
jgi:ribonuclease J